MFVNLRHLHENNDKNRPGTGHQMQALGRAQHRQCRKMKSHTTAF